MESTVSTSISSIFLVLFFGLVAFQSSARDTITFDSKLRSDKGETLVSAGKIFELGFFQPGAGLGATFVGIWYYSLETRTVVWVANRDSPLFQVPAGILEISHDGNVRVLDLSGVSHFQTDVPSSTAISSRTLRLLDSGNLALYDDNSSGTGKYLWQSFTKPTDTFLPGMVMDESLMLVSWMDPTNPASGKFSFQVDEGNSKVFTIKQNKSSIYWRSDHSDSADLPPLITCFLSNCTNHTTRKQIPRNLQSHDFNYSNSRLLMNTVGEIQFYSLENKTWSLLWYEPLDGCSAFRPCGRFGLCNNTQGGGKTCKCLPGFSPILHENWGRGVFSNGCGRNIPTCGENPKPDQFLSLKSMNVEKSNRLFSVANESLCRQTCLEDCQSPCEAYYYKEVTFPREDTMQNGEGNCWIWTDPSNLQESPNNDTGHDVYIRWSDSPAASAAKTTARPSKAVIIVTTLAGVSLLACSIGCIFYRRIKGGKNEMLLGNLERDDEDLVDEDGNIVDLAYFSLESILEATQNFSDANKLGQGGFGPVYKGVFPGGQEIAVKRLLSQSGQGMDEFRNEVITIAKLQHRNLVRLLGYCIKGPERLLLYEYMPNTSLDTFIFDQERCALLDWSMRFDIILGIARGLLYLHEDSRLRIIHRDLKTSNILLDEHMNPKISDFGLARIFAGKEIEANTMRVVGTYGYMSPEYAQAGFYSVKSDVFSFGVIVLEIISGKRNTGFYNSEKALSLLGHAWRLWEEGNAINLVDGRISKCSRTGDVTLIKCINIGLLCVQDDPSDRPTMSNALHMLRTEVTTTLPILKEPGFVPGKFAESHSVNKMSITLPKGR